jgi:hypothetical protein
MISEKNSIMYFSVREIHVYCSALNTTNNIRQKLQIG